MLRFSAGFPRGPAAVGLLVLRLVLATCLITDGATQTAGALAGTGGAVLREAFGLALMTCGALVAVGFLTVATQAVVVVAAFGLLGLRAWLPVFENSPNGSWQLSLLEASLAASLALVGPGAYSIDALAFGRRELTVSPRRESSRAPVAATSRTGLPQ